MASSAMPFDSGGGLMPSATLEGMLSQMVQGDSNQIRQAEEALSAALDTPAFMLDLLNRLTTSPTGHVRQLSAVLLRRRIGGHWKKLGEANTALIKSALLQVLATEPEQPVVRSVAALAASVARHAMAKGGWPELLNFVLEGSRSVTPAHRLVAMVLVASLLESDDVVERLREHYTLLRDLLSAALQDAESAAVSRGALKALAAWAPSLAGEEDCALLRPLVPQVFTLGGRALGEAHDETVSLVCSLLDELLEQDGAVHSSQIGHVADFALSVASAPSLELECRASALNLVATIVGTRRKAVVKQKMLSMIVARLFEVCAVAPPPGGEVLDEEDGASVHKMAAQVFETISEVVPSKHVMPLILELVRTHAPSPDPGRRRAVLVMLAVMAAGCAEAFAAQLPSIIQVVYAGCEAPEEKVREAACLAIGLFAQSLHPEILEYYQKILPYLFEVLADARGEVQQRACYAIEAFCEHLGPDILPFLAPLLDRLTTLLQQAPERATQERAVSAIAAVAVGAKAAFAPHFDAIYALMRHLLRQSASDMLVLRARAMECAGLMCLAVGRNTCAHVLQELVGLAMAGLQVDAPELREYTFGFFAQMAELMGAEMGPLLPPLLPFLIRAIQQEECTELAPADQARILAKLGRDADGEDDDELEGLEGDLGDDEDLDEEDDEAGGMPGIHTALLDEKAAAVHCIGACAVYGGAIFAPHIEGVMGPLLECADHFHEDVRGALVRTLSHLLRSCAAAEPPAPWTKGEVPSSAKLGKATRWLLQRTWRTLVSTFKDDDDKDTVAAAAESISEVVLLLGPHVLGNAPWHPASTDPLVGGALALLEQRHACQEMAQDLSEGGGVDEEDDHDEASWEAVSELLTALPKVLGERWAPHLEKLMPALMPYLREAHPLSDNALAIGILAEGLHHIGAEGRRYLPTLLPHALRCSAAGDATCRQNGVFCLGILGANGGEAVLPHMQVILTALQQRLAADEEPVVRDNAVGALSRLAVTFGTALPLSAILPAIAERLPLTADEGENAPAIRCLARLMHADETRPHAVPHLPNLLATIGHLLAGGVPAAAGGDGKLPGNVESAGNGATPKCPLDAEIEAEARAFLAWAAAQSPEQMQAAVMGLPARERDALMSALQQSQG